MIGFRRKVLSALGWESATKISGQFIAWGVTLYVVRMLAPEDYGTMAIAFAMVGVLTRVGESGMGAAVVQSTELTDRVVRKLLGFVMIVSGLLGGVLFLVAPAVSAAFGSPALLPILRIQSFSVPIVSMAVLPRALFQRKLNFRAPSLIDFAAQLLGAVIALTLAWRGFGVWALVWSTFVAVAASSIAVFAFSGFHHRPDFDSRGIGRLVRFGTWLTLAQLTWMLSSQADIFVVGTVLGGQALGFYALAKQIAQLPLNKVQGILNSVAFPAYSAVRAGGCDSSWYVQKQIRLVGLVAFPVFLGICAVAPEAVEIVLGPKWRGVIVPLQIVALATPFQMLESAFAPFLNASGHARVVFGNTVITLVVCTSAIAIGTAGGLVGVSAACAASTILVFLITLVRTSAATDLRASAVIVDVGRVAAPGLVMLLAVTGAGSWLRVHVDPPGTLAVLMLLGAVVYTLCACIVCSPCVREMVTMLRPCVPGGGAVAGHSRVVETLG